MTPKQKGSKNREKARDYISACRIKNRSGLRRSSEPVERKPLLLITAKAVIEGQVSSMKQEAPYISGE